MALDIFALQMTPDQKKAAATTKDTTSSRDYISALWAEYKRELSDRRLGHLVQFDNPMPQEHIDIAPQVEARQHKAPSEKNYDFEQISRQMSASSEEGCPVVIPPAYHNSNNDTPTQRRESWFSRLLERPPPSGVTEQLVHMAFTVS
ncbi:hypothetical protein AAFC00_007296 [Neodothiora populina]